ncbi:MAG: hypothetical protein FJ222_02165 [Lentisphaerae bacterium]|nr:hypothetical protein [Lentisphaerota bacterium]
MNCLTQNPASRVARDLDMPRDRLSLSGVVWTLLAALVVSGCATGATRVAAGRTALEVQAAADSAITAYEALRAVAADSAYNQGYLRVVVSPQPDSVDFTRVPDASMNDLLDTRVRTCRLVKESAAQLRLACEASARAEAVQSFAAAVEALQGISADTTSSVEFKKLAAALPNDLTLLWQARRIARLHTALGRAAAELGTLWKRERPTWEDYVKGAYITQYASGLLALRLSNFDENELSRKVADPYHPGVKAGLFKLQKFHEAVRSADTIRLKLRQASEAFERISLPQAPVTGTSQEE